MNKGDLLMRLKTNNSCIVLSQFDYIYKIKNIQSKHSKNLSNMKRNHAVREYTRMDLLNCNYHFPVKNGVIVVQRFRFFCKKKFDCQNRTGYDCEYYHTCYYTNDKPQTVLLKVKEIPRNP